MSKLNFTDVVHAIERLNVPAPEWQDQELRRRYWHHSNVPLLHARAIGKLKSDDVNECSQKWWRALQATREAIARGGIVALLGNRGTGKTQIAVKLIYECCNDIARPATYLRAHELFAAIRGSFSSGMRAEIRLLERYEQHQFLVIDEAHESADTDFERRILNHLLNGRYNALKPTLLISNENVQAFQQRIGPSIADRLRETGKIIECCWQSFRHRTGVVQKIT